MALLGRLGTTAQHSQSFLYVTLFTFFSRFSMTQMGGRGTSTVVLEVWLLIL